MTNFTPSQVALEGGNDLGGTHRPKAELGWGGFAFSESGSEFGGAIEDFHNGTRQMGEPAVGFGSENEVGGPLEPMPSADIRSGSQEETAPESFGGMTRVPLPPLSQDDNGQVVFMQRSRPDGRDRG
ncbi:hypothetical protein HAHE_40370 [Haloferula helveola]|uniref:Uncharacterized protein n=1 Tax=Haloferula helveola TaxID=490095 RepID=A0ABM7RKF7_9BACT|nr:hypothetical protein HAHE_40370 [Haloferula helveola]